MKQEFKEFPKLSRLSREIIITEKIDGTNASISLTNNFADEFPKIGEDIGAQRVLKRLIKNGHRLILYTMRSDLIGEDVKSPEFKDVTGGLYLTEAINWFKNNDISLYAIQINPTQNTWTTSPKCYAQLYIDDAALGIPLKYDKDRPYVDWEMVEKILIGDGIIKISNIQE